MCFVCVSLKKEEKRLQELWLQDLQVCVPWSQAEQLGGQKIAGFNFEEAV